MKANAVLKRWVAFGVTAGVFGLVLVVMVRSGGVPVQGQADDKTQPVRAEVKAGDWWIYGGTQQRNFVNTRDTGIPAEFDVDKGTNVAWSVDLGSMAYGGPIVAGGKVFIGTNNETPRDPKITGDKGVLMCFRESDGKFLWQAAHDKLAAGRVQDWPYQGICSSPVVEGNKLYYVSNRCELVCADTEGDGKGGPKFLWTLDMIKKLQVFPHNLAVCSPLLVGDHLYVVTANGVDEGHINIPAPAAPSFICVSKADGKVVWQNNFPSESLVQAQKKGGTVDIKQLVNDGRLLMHGQWSNPVYADVKGQPQVIFPGGDGWLYAFEPKKGELLWKFECNPKGTKYELGGRGTKNDFIATPVVWENKLYIGVGQDPEHKEGVGHYWCVDITREPKNPEKDLTPRGGNFDPKDPGNKDSGLVWYYGGVAPKGSDRTWLFGRTMSTAAIHEGILYVADLGGMVYCFDANTGKKLWDHNMESTTWSSPYWVDGKVFMGNDDGKMYVFGHGKEKKILAEIEMGGGVKTTPVAANGVLYVLTENSTKLHAIKTGKQRK